MKIIGIVGGTGAGKTTALKELELFNVEILDCDKIYYELLGNSEELKQSIIKRFGNVFDNNGLLDRHKLGNVVFNDSNALNDLNSITFKFIEEEVYKRIEIAKTDGKCGVVIDAVALLESNLKDVCDVVVGVIAPESTRVKRIMQREGITEKYAKHRIASQKSNLWYIEHCDFIIENNGDLEQFQQKVRKFFKKLL